MDHNNFIETWTTVLVKQFKYLFHEYLECSPLIIMMNTLTGLYSTWKYHLCIMSEGKQLPLFSATDSGAVKNPDCGCQLLTFKDYTDMLWTTLAEFPGTE